MKLHTSHLLVVFALAFVAINKTNAQITDPCTPADNVVVTVTNLVCVGGDHLEFNLTITKNGAVVGGTTDIKRTSNGVAIAASFLGAVNGVPVVANTGTGCPDLTSLYVDFAPATTLNCEPLLLIPPPIPTMGQWGLISLGFLLLIFGIVGIRQKVISDP